MILVIDPLSCLGSVIIDNIKVYHKTRRHKHAQDKKLKFWQRPWNVCYISCVHCNSKTQYWQQNAESNVVPSKLNIYHVMNSWLFNTHQIKTPPMKFYGKNDLCHWLLWQTLYIYKVKRHSLKTELILSVTTINNGKTSIKTLTDYQEFAWKSHQNNIKVNLNSTVCYALRKVTNGNCISKHLSEFTTFVLFSQRFE